MSLHRYAGECNGLALELEESLTTKDIDALRADCAALGADGWFRWIFAKLDPIHDYISATPAQRRKKKVWQEPALRCRLALAAIQHVTRAHSLLDGIEQHSLSPGSSYREMASRAGEAYLDIFFGQNTFEYWPFEPPNPFDEE